MTQLQKSRSPQTGNYACVRCARFQSRRFAANHSGCDGAAPKIFQPAAAQILAVANVAGKLSAKLAAVCECRRWFRAAKKRNAGIVASETPRVGKGIRPSAEKSFKRAAFAGFGSDCVRHGNAKFSRVDFAASARAFAAFCASAAGRNSAGFHFAGTIQNHFPIAG